MLIYRKQTTSQFASNLYKTLDDIPEGGNTNRFPISREIV